MNLHRLHWVSFVPLFWALEPGKRNARIGYASGWIAVFLLFFWLIETVIRFSNLPWIAAFFVHVIFATAFAIPYALVFGPVHWFRERIGLAWVAVIPAIQVTVEALSPALFPYYHGVSQYRTEWMWQLASVTGISGLSYLVFLSNAGLAEGIYRKREGRTQPWKLYALIATLLIGNLGFGMWRHQNVEAKLSEAPTLRAAILQQSITMEERLDQSAVKALASWVTLTNQITDEEPDLVVWPEGSVSIPEPADNERSYQVLGNQTSHQYFSRLSNTGDYDLLIGGGTIEFHTDTPDMENQKSAGGMRNSRRYTAYNSSYVFDRSGNLGGRYDKMIPLPFGEYIPFSDVFPFLRDLIEGPGNFRAGTVPVFFQGTTHEGESYTFSSPICYEAILEEQVQVLSAADLMVNITNDAWFGDTASTHQHAMLAAGQAMQVGVPLLRIGYTGVSFVVEPHGAIRFETKAFEESAKVEEVRLASVQTLYQRGGWLFSWLCVAGVLGAWSLARKREGQTNEDQHDLST